MLILLFSQQNQLQLQLFVRMLKSILYTSVGLTSALPHWNQGTIVYDGDRTFNENVQIQDSPFDYYLDQKLDHFDRSNNELFQQRYFVNTTYWKGEDAPVFLCVGGEGPPLTYMVLVSSVHCNDMVELAPKHGALLLALEHRYYGPSTPHDNWSTDNLKYLSSEQALGDIAHFHTEMTTKFGLTEANKWVTFGGSYPGNSNILFRSLFICKLYVLGMMAGLARLRYPHMVHASVSSSSPLEAQVEMAEYYEVVANSMSNEYVGGSSDCLNAIKDGHVTVGEMLTTETGRRDLESLFNVCGKNALENEQNQEQFAGNGVVYLPVQSNDPACATPYCNIEKVCDLMVDTSIGSPLDRLVSLHKAQSGGACTVVSHDLVMKALAEPTNPERAWLYQTCNEWGFYQTCPVGSSCPYVQGLHTVDSDYEMCQQSFNISQSSVDDNIEFANAMYGGKNIQGTRIMYPNGEIDPWSSLGVLESPNDQEPVLWVKGASHHFWTHTSLPSDDQYVIQAREAIWNQVSMIMFLIVF